MWTCRPIFLSLITDIPPLFQRGFMGHEVATMVKVVGARTMWGFQIKNFPFTSRVRVVLRKMPKHDIYAIIAMTLSFSKSMSIWRFEEPISHLPNKPLFGPHITLTTKQQQIDIINIKCDLLIIKILKKKESLFSCFQLCHSVYLLLNRVLTLIFAFLFIKMNWEELFYFYFYILIESQIKDSRRIY